MRRIKSIIIDGLVLVVGMIVLNGGVLCGRVVAVAVDVEEGVGESDVFYFFCIGVGEDFGVDIEGDWHTDSLLSV